MNDKPNYSLGTGVAWAIAAKNSLKNVYRFSPNQLVLGGKKTNFPNVESNKLPALDGVTCSKIVAENLSVMDDARQAFIKSESDEKLRGAFRHQGRISSEVKYVTGGESFSIKLGQVLKKSMLLGIKCITRDEQTTIGRDQPR